MPHTKVNRPSLTGQREESLLELHQRYSRDTKHEPLRVGVAVDGSLVSEKALELGAHFARSKKESELKVLHVWADKSYLPAHLQPPHLEQEYTKKCKGVYKVPGAEFIKAKRKDEESTCEALTGLATHNVVNLLVVGSFGRKGEKLDMLGSTSDATLRSCAAHVAVVKSGTLMPGRAAKFLVATDFSQSADYALLFTMHRLMGPNDTLSVVAVQSDLRTDKIGTMEDVSEVERVMADLHIHGKAQLQTIGREDSIADAILDRAEAEQADFIVMGICGHDHRDVGSVTENIMRRARCTAIAVKNPYMTAKNAMIGLASLSLEASPSGLRGTSMRVSAGVPSALPRRTVDNQPFPLMQRRTLDRTESSSARSSFNAH